ncbi:MAG: hypothetical protein IJ158_11930 [Treponema sp.]|nr:hypothetical protein [Treponema sp.]
MGKKEAKITMNDNSINVGNGNTITSSNIGNNNQIAPKENKNFFERHPIFIGIIIAFVGGSLVYVFLETNLWTSIKNLISSIGI